MKGYAVKRMKRSFPGHPGFSHGVISANGFKCALLSPVSEACLFENNIKNVGKRALTGAVKRLETHLLGLDKRDFLWSTGFSNKDCDLIANTFSMLVEGKVSVVHRRIWIAVIAFYGSLLELEFWKDILGPVEIENDLIASLSSIFSSHDRAEDFFLHLLSHKVLIHSSERLSDGQDLFTIAKREVQKGWCFEEGENIYPPMTA